MNFRLFIENLEDRSVILQKLKSALKNITIAKNTADNQQLLSKAFVDLKNSEQLLKALWQQQKDPMKSVAAKDSWIFNSLYQYGEAYSKKHILEMLEQVAKGTRELLTNKNGDFDLPTGTLNYGIITGLKNFNEFWAQA